MAEFKYHLPMGNEISKDQQIAIDKNHATIVTGHPGTGKTVVSIFRLRNKLKRGENVIFFTYMNLLKYALLHNDDTEEDFSNIESKIHTLYQWFADNGGGWLSDFKGNPIDLKDKLQEISPYFDEIIVDEGQDFFDDIYTGLESICSNIFIGADNNQIVIEKGIVDKISTIKSSLSNDIEDVELAVNYRNSFETFIFAAYFLPPLKRHELNNTLDKMERGTDKPIIHIVKKEEQVDNLIKKLLAANKNKTMGVLLNTIKEVAAYNKYFTDRYNAECSMWHGKIKKKDKEILGTNLKSIIITTFKSAKGVEFDIVIIPKFHSLKEHINPEKSNITEHYVGLTRAKEVVHLISYHKIPDYVLENIPTDLYVKRVH